MAINQLNNLASITYNNTSILSNSVQTALSLPPTIVKAVDLAIASVGDTITYTVIVTNVAIFTINHLPFRDALPAGCVYVDGSFSVNGTTEIPTNTSNVLTYTIAHIAAAGTATIRFQGLVTGV